MIDRKVSLNKLISESFELLVIGGGITGAGIALDAASRGIKVALIEKKDFASGTSSKSTKLIHGGLRYLKQFNFGLVAKTGRERGIIHRIAPHLVLPDKMILPFYKDGTFGKFSTRVGLFAYDTLAGVSGNDRFRILSSRKTMRMVPHLDREGLMGSGFYAEYRTDDARLTIENIKMASIEGAHCVNYVECNDFVYENDKISKVVVKDTLEGRAFEIKAQIIVNAAGPWVDVIRDQDEAGFTGKKLVLSKGIHLVFSQKDFPLEHTVYFDKGDGRLVFAVPRNDTVYVGTTDTLFNGDTNHIEVTLSDVEYLLEAIIYKFPNLNLDQSHILSSWAGVRPLIYEEGKDVSEISRKDEIFISKSGLITIAGGKLTGYRHMAMDIISSFLNQLDGDFKTCKTADIKLTTNPFENYQEVLAAISTFRKRLSSPLVPEWMPTYLIHNYGKISFDMIDSIPVQDLNLETITIEELRYGLKHESVQTLLDFYERRTGRLYFQIDSILPTLDSVAETAGKYLNWEDTRIQSELESIRMAVNRSTTFI